MSYIQNLNGTILKRDLIAAERLADALAHLLGPAMGAVAGCERAMAIWTDIQFARAVLTDHGGETVARRGDELRAELRCRAWTVPPLSPRDLDHIRRGRGGRLVRFTAVEGAVAIDDLDRLDALVARCRRLAKPPPTSQALARLDRARQRIARLRAAGVGEVAR
jgi:hypothetical protein